MRKMQGDSKTGVNLFVTKKLMETLENYTQKNSYKKKHKNATNVYKKKLTKKNVYLPVLTSLIHHVLCILIFSGLILVID